MARWREDNYKVPRQRRQVDKKASIGKSKAIKKRISEDDIIGIYLQYLRALLWLLAAEQSVIVLSDADKAWIKSVIGHG